MSNFKIITSLDTGSIISTHIRRVFDECIIPCVEGNIDYQQFIQDVAEQGIEIVEGPDIIEPDYATLRQQEYPSREEQLDMMYWDKVNGTTVWEDTIQAIKDKYPKTITGGTTIGPIPDWVQEAVDAYNASINT